MEIAAGGHYVKGQKGKHPLHALFFPCVALPVDDAIPKVVERWVVKSGSNKQQLQV